MKEITITLTAKEIEALQISVCAERLNLENDIDRLKEHNRTGINTKKIKAKAERVQDLDALFDKLYQAEKLLEV